MAALSIRYQRCLKRCLEQALLGSCRIVTHIAVGKQTDGTPPRSLPPALRVSADGYMLV